MIIKDFLNDAKRVIEVVDNNEKIINFLESISYGEKPQIDTLKKLWNSVNIKESKSALQAINETKKLLYNQSKVILDEIRKYKPYIFVTQLQLLASDLKQINIFDGELRIFIESDVQQLIELHTDAYSEKRFEDIFNFITSCKNFIYKLYKFRYTAEISLNNLKLETVSVPENNQIIDIQIVNQQYSLYNFSSFISFIDQLYQDLCKSSSIHYEDFPFNIIKIESGSDIWGEFFGHSELVKLIKDLIIGLAGYIRDLQTGKVDLEKFQNSVRKADLVLDLMIKAKEYGIDETNKVLLEKTFNNAISNFSKYLPKTTTEIIIDNEPILKLNEIEIKAIEGKQLLMLKGKKKSGAKNKIKGS
jgi:hypothetical protein